MNRLRAKRFLTAAAVVALAIPALAQERPTSILPPGFGEPPPTQNNASPAQPGRPDQLAPAPEPSPTEGNAVAAPGNGEDQTTETDSLTAADEAAADVPKPPEVPDSARRDPSLVGRLDPMVIGIGTDPWAAASGQFLERAMRRTNGALPSRWLHIALRNALLARAPTPFGVNPADWVAERAWLLLRMGEADAARMLVSGVDVADFTPKLTQVATQSALANADPAGLCPLRDSLNEVEPRIAPLVDAICSSLSGNPETAAADIDDARRRGRMGGIDVSLADKLVGAGADTKRAVTIEWDPVSQLNVWRFGLASATGLGIPDRLLADASPQMRAWQARAPMLATDQRLASARIAAGLGVFSGKSLVDVYSGQYDRTDPDELSQTDAWQLRVAFLGRDQDARLGAMRKLWTKAADDPIEREATGAMLGIAASRVAPNAALADDAPDLISSMLAAGMDEEAARWVPALAGMDEKANDRCWAMLALAAPSARGLDLSYARVDKFISRDGSAGKRRGALLVAGLSGLGRLDSQSAGRLSGRYGFGLDRRDEWTNLIDGATARRQGGTATVLASLAFQAAHWNAVPALFLFHSVAALNGTGQAFNARMIAAEALSRS
ncbi:MAG: hypothetical protein ABR588_04545 [Sphingomicrobium sp.]|nr:hypothetical protein [Sphingomonadales bacterium]